MSEAVLVRREGPVAWLLLNRPERRNALDLDMWRELGEAVKALSGDPGLRCLVLRGAGGKAFAAGADIAEFERTRGSAEAAARYAEVMDPAMEAVRDCPAPTLAVIEGACVGGGLELAVQCDLRLAGASARLGMPINRIGHALPYPAMTALVELVGRATTLELLLEGCILNAEEAYYRRLVTRVVADDALEAEAEALVARIIAGAPLAARWHKVFAAKALRPESLTAEDRLEPFQSCDTADYREGIRAFLAKETPKFKGE
jgi:enoyl-CoA hydratase/carnithine racemase